MQRTGTFGGGGGTLLGALGGTGDDAADHQSVQTSGVLAARL